MESTLTPLPGCPKDGVHLSRPQASLHADQALARGLILVTANTQGVRSGGGSQLRGLVDLRQRTPMKLHIDLNLDFQLQTMETPFSECVSSSL